MYITPRAAAPARVHDTTGKEQLFYATFSFLLFTRRGHQPLMVGRVIVGRESLSWAENKAYRKKVDRMSRAVRPVD